MKKMFALLAVIVSIVIAAVPMTACAEPFGIGKLILSDPVVTYNGETALDLTGLDVSLGGGISEDGSVARLLLDLYGADNPVASALLQVDDGGIAGFISGMSSAYGVPAEYVEAAVKTTMESSAISMEELEHWELPKQLGDAVTAYTEANAQYGDAYDYEVELSTGTVTGSYMPFNMECNELLAQLAALMDGDEIASAFLQGMILELDASFASYTEMLAAASINWSLRGGYVLGENYTFTQMILVMDSDGSEVLLTGEVLSEDVDEYTSNTSLVLSMTPADEEYAGQSIYLTVDVLSSGEKSSVVGHVGYNFGDSDVYDLSLMCSLESEAFTAMLNDSTGAVNVYCTVTPGAFDANIALDGETISAYGRFGDDSGFSAGFNAGANGGLDINYAPFADAEVNGGTLAISMFDSVDTYGLNLNVRTETGAVDTEDVNIDTASMLDITALTDEQMNVASTELNDIMAQALTALMEYVPGLVALFY